MTAPNPEGDVVLAPCPFCGSPAEVERDSDHHGQWYNLGCSRHWGKSAEDKCIAGRMFYTESDDGVPFAEAVSTWNRRAALQPSPDGVKAVVIEAVHGAMEAHSVDTGARAGNAMFYDVVEAVVASLPPVLVSGLEPVAWRYRFVTTTDGKEWSDWHYADERHEVPSNPRQTVQPLYARQQAAPGSDLVGRYITISEADGETGSAVLSPDEPASGVYWTLIGSGPDHEQNRLGQQIVAAINRGLAAPGRERGE